MKHSFQALLEKHDKSEATAITIPTEVFESFGTRARVPVCGTINGVGFRSSIFTMHGVHFMVVNKALRESAKIVAGETVSVVLERDHEPRVVTPPPDLRAALQAHPEARAAWEKLSYTHQKEYVIALEAAKKAETRTRRLEKALNELRMKKQARAAG